MRKGDSNIAYLRLDLHLTCRRWAAERPSVLRLRYTIINLYLERRAAQNFCLGRIRMMLCQLCILYRGHPIACAKCARAWAPLTLPYRKKRLSN